MTGLTVREIGAILGFDLEIDTPISSFEHDSRSVKNGSLFFALKGETHDAHAFLEQVAAQGAIAAVVSVEERRSFPGMILFPVANVLGALHKLAQEVHAKRKGCVVGVTGSVGKTTTKEFIATLLEGRFFVKKTFGSSNSQVTMPLGVLNLGEDPEVFVIEMGMSQKGELERLVAIAPPKISVITKIALAHSLFFPEGIEGIAQAKMELLSHPHTQTAILNVQVEEFESHFPKGEYQRVGYGGEASEYKLEKEGDSYVVIERGVASPQMTLPFEATHLCENFLAAVAVARALGMEWETIKKQALKLKPYAHRFEKKERGGVVFIDDAYNANPTSMLAALSNLPMPLPGGKRVGVLGSMKELGEYTEQGHLQVAQKALSCVDHLLCLGVECQVMVDHFLQAGKPAEFFDDLEKIKTRLFELAKPGDVVLLKGSKSKELWKVLNEETVKSF